MFQSLQEWIQAEAQFSTSWTLEKTPTIYNKAVQGLALTSAPECLVYIQRCPSTPGPKRTPMTHVKPYNQRDYFLFFHPPSTTELNTQPNVKPIPLMRYLVHTFTNPGQAVLDMTAGTGALSQAAMLEGRSSLGFEPCYNLSRTANGRLVETCKRANNGKCDFAFDNSVGLTQASLNWSQENRPVISIARRPYQRESDLQHEGQGTFTICNLLCFNEL